MSLFKPTTEQRETLKKAVARYAHEPSKSQMLASLDADNCEYEQGAGNWDHLKFCVEQHLLHAQTEARRDPNKKSAKRILTEADALARKFFPNFS